MTLSPTARGLLLTMAGASLWGISGTAAQFVQQNRMVEAEGLVTLRLLVASLIIIVGSYAQGRNSIFAIFTNGKDVARLCIFGLVGIAMCQYTYFKAIFYAGAGVASVLQYVAPTMLIVYAFLNGRRRPTTYEVLSVVIAFVGVCFISLKGNFSLGSFNGTILFWGLLSAVAVAFYTASPLAIMKKYGTGPVLGFGSLAGWIGAELAFRPVYFTGIWDVWTFICVFGGIILIGTVVAFNVYLKGIALIGPVKGSTVASVEPLSAALFSFAFLHDVLGVYEIIGFVCILSTVFILGKNTVRHRE